MTRKQIENTIPVLGVTALERSIEFYRRVLGFEVDWNAGHICSVSRDGAEVLAPPANKHWAYEMTIADPDGNVLWLGDEPRS